MTEDRSHLPGSSLTQNATSALEAVGSLLEQGTAVLSLAIGELEGCEALAPSQIKTLALALHSAQSTFTQAVGRLDAVVEAKYAGRADV